MSDKPKDGTDDPEPRITYIGSPAKSAAGKRIAALRKEKLRLLKGETASETEEDDCESSAINVAYIAALFGMVTGAIAVYKHFFTGKDKYIPELQPVSSSR